MSQKSSAVLLLSNGLFFEGQSCGASGEAVAEIIFDTNMMGYQELLTEPANAGRILCFSYPTIGNYGVNDEDSESDRIQVSGVVVRELAKHPSSWRSLRSLGEWLKEEGIVAIEAIDTRQLIKSIRNSASVKAIISTVDFNQESLAKKLESFEAEAAYAGNSVLPDFEGKPRFKVLSFDTGINSSTVKAFAAQGIEINLISKDLSPAGVLAQKADGLFIGEGALLDFDKRKLVELLKNLVGKMPILGLGLGHELLGTALGFEFTLLNSSHEGANIPTQFLATGQVDIAKHNHAITLAFKLDDQLVWGGENLKEFLAKNEKPVIESLQTKAEITHLNLNDYTIEGVRYEELDALGMHHLPNADPYTKENPLISKFIELMEAKQDK